MQITSDMFRVKIAFVPGVIECRRDLRSKFVYSRSFEKMKRRESEAYFRAEKKIFGPTIPSHSVAVLRFIKARKTSLSSARANYETR